MIGGHDASTLDVEAYHNLALIGVRDMASPNEVFQFCSPVIPGCLSFADFSQFWTYLKRDRLIVTWNGAHYDNAMVAAVLHGMDDPVEFRALSDQLIASKDHRDRLPQIDGEVGCDVFAMLGGARSRVGSLKEAAAKLGFRKLLESPTGFDAPLTEEEMQAELEYNRIDLEATALIATVCQSAILERLALSLEFNVNVVSKHDAAVAETIMKKRLFGDAKPMYRTQTTWHLKGHEITKPFDGLFNHPELIALVQRINDWDLRMEVIEEMVDDED